MKEFKIQKIDLQSPVHKAALIVGIGLVLNMALIFFMILPVKRRMAECIHNTDETIANNDRMSALVRTTSEKRASVAALQEKYDTLQEHGVLTPLLNSYAMRAKRLVEPCALQSGLNIENATELTPIPLQQPLPLKNSAFYRQPIEFTAFGSYAQITEFIAAMETEHPMSILYSLKINAQQRTPEVHKIQICYEWPSKIGQISEPQALAKP